MFKSITPNIMVESVEKTITFYTNNLGFNVMISVPNDDELVWAMLCKDECSIMFQLKESLIEEYETLKIDVIKPSLSLYIKVEDIDKLYNDLKTKVKFAKDMHNTFYNTKEFAIFDNNNNILTIGE